MLPGLNARSSILEDAQFTEAIKHSSLIAGLNKGLRNDNFRNMNLEITNSEMEIEKLEVWNGPSRPPYLIMDQQKLDILIQELCVNIKFACHSILRYITSN